MTSNNFEEQDPLETLLDQESDSEFGLPVFREHLDKDQAPLVLKEWSAKDFSDIYVRFHPHLLRHAKRYLTNHSQAEEVVQDAFLYLMTSLPEIDSEVGALKLLKWKVRNLALDVISANSKARFAPIDDQFDLEAQDESVDESILRADESAIVSLALAKLQPRQREALIASIYQEKATVDVAQQLGLNENATRQLIHRAKGAFKKALIGEAQTAGLSISQILSIAARKASQDAGKYIQATSALLLVLVISIGVLPNLGSPSGAGLADGVRASEPEVSEPSEARQMAPLAVDSEAPVAVLEPELATAEAALVVVVETELVAEASYTESVELLADPLNATTQTVLFEAPAVQQSVDLSPFDPWLIDPMLSRSVIESELVLGNSQRISLDNVYNFTAMSDLGVWVDFGFKDQDADPFRNVRFGFSAQGQSYWAKPTQADFLVQSLSATTDRYAFVGLVGGIVDSSGTSWSSSRLDGATFSLTITVDKVSGKLSQVEFSVSE